MNNLKFRVWVEDHFAYSAEGPPDSPRDGDVNFGFEEGVFKAWVFTTVTPDDMYEPPYPSAEEVESPIEQFAGRKDKNGVGIYEGDRIRNSDFVGNPDCWNNWESVVTWDESNWAWRGMDGEVVIIIGNIHDKEPE